MRWHKGIPENTGDYLVQTTDNVYYVWTYDAEEKNWYDSLFQVTDDQIEKITEWIQIEEIVDYLNAIEFYG